MLTPGSGLPDFASSGERCGTPAICHFTAVASGTLFKFSGFSFPISGCRLGSKFSAQGTRERHLTPGATSGAQGPPRPTTLPQALPGCPRKPGLRPESRGGHRLIPSAPPGSTSPGPPGPGLLSGKPRQLVHRASWEEEPGTLRARPSAVQLRWGWHRSELELLAEKVPGGHGWHCVFWLGVPGDDGEDGVKGSWVSSAAAGVPAQGCRPGGPTPTRGDHAGARRAGRVL